MVGTWVMFRNVVSQVVLTWFPIYVKLSLFNTISQGRSRYPLIKICLLPQLYIAQLLSTVETGATT